jgi:hypothetical protein
MSQHSLRDDDDGGDDGSLPGPHKGHAQRLHDKSSGKRRPLPPPERTTAGRAVLEEVQQLKAELAKARADAAAAVALASERDQTGLGGSVDRLRSRACYRDCCWLPGRGKYSYALVCLGAGVQPVMPRRPGASLANPNKAARRVTAVEFASDSED